MWDKAQLLIVPGPGIGHLVSTVEIAKLLVDPDQRLSVTLLIMKLPNESNTALQSLLPRSDDARIDFIELPHDDNTVPGDANARNIRKLFIESHKVHVKEVVSKLMTWSKANPDSPQLAGLIIDMFCTTMTDVANEFGIPTYMFFTSGAGGLGLMLHLQILQSEHNIDTTEYKDSDTELDIPGFMNPFPTKCLPTGVLVKELAREYMAHAKRFRETKGIMVNTFMELESFMIHSLLEDTKCPPIYPVGPILNVESKSNGSEIMEWLDNQPQCSVVFLCFGSKGSFDEDQVKEIARALENCGHRFLWSLRAPGKEKLPSPAEYSNLNEILPYGFLKNTSGRGRVIGWAPQVEILAHPAIRGFVSHGGWNSILETLWYGVPIATLPLYAEQQLNAFMMVVEKGLGVEIKMDYRRDGRMESNSFVTAQEIGRGLRKLMDLDDPENSDRRRKVKEMTVKSIFKIKLTRLSSLLSLVAIIIAVLPLRPISQVVVSINILIRVSITYKREKQTGVSEQYSVQQ